MKIIEDQTGNIEWMNLTISNALASQIVSLNTLLLQDHSVETSRDSNELTSRKDAVVQFLDEFYGSFSRHKPLTGIRNDFGVFMPADLESVAQLLQHTLRDQPSVSFLDLGSGDGRAVILASLLFRMKACGYELDEQYFQISQLVLDRLKLPGVSFQKDNFLNATLPDYDVVMYFDGGSYSSRYEGPQSRPTKFFEKLSTMKEGAQLALLHGHKLQEHLSRFECFQQIHKIPAVGYPSYIFVRTAAPLPSEWETVFPPCLKPETERPHRLPKWL